MILVVIYLIDARDVLYSKEPGGKEVDWSCLGLFDDKPKCHQGEELDFERGYTSRGGSEPRLSNVEIDIVSSITFSLLYMSQLKMHAADTKDSPARKTSQCTACCVAYRFLDDRRTRRCQSGGEQGFGGCVCTNTR